MARLGDLEINLELKLLYLVLGKYESVQFPVVHNISLFVVTQNFLAVQRY